MSGRCVERGLVLYWEAGSAGTLPTSPNLAYLGCEDVTRVASRKPTATTLAEEHRAAPQFGGLLAGIRSAKLEVDAGVRERDSMAEPGDVDLFFAGDQRQHVEDVARLLRDSGMRVSHDDHEVAPLWGKNPATFLDETCTSKRLRCCVLFASADYMCTMWTAQ